MQREGGMANDPPAHDRGLPWQPQAALLTLLAASAPVVQPAAPARPAAPGPPPHLTGTLGSSHSPRCGKPLRMARW
jgi:hypothetical protein